MPTDLHDAWPATPEVSARKVADSVKPMRDDDVLQLLEDMRREQTQKTATMVGAGIILCVASALHIESIRTDIHKLRCV